MFDRLKSASPQPNRDASRPETSNSIGSAAPMWTAVAFVGALSVLMTASPPPTFSGPLLGAATARPIYLATLIANAGSEPSGANSLSIGSAASGVLPVSQTFVVTLRPASGLVLRGRLRASKRTVTGQAPMAGQVARVLVRPGRRVDVGDRILDLSTGATSRAPRRADGEQNAAEQAQVAAVARQHALEAKMNGARQRFAVANARVEEANRRLDEARDMVAKLRAGETVPMPKHRTEATPVRRSRRSRRASRAPQSTLRADEARGAADEAMQAAVKAQRDADRLSIKARNAFFVASAADGVAQQKKSRIDAAQEKLRKVEEKFAANEAKAADVEAARAEASEAQNDAKDAADKAGVARREADALQTQRDEAKEKSRLAASQATRSLPKLHLFAAAPDAKNGQEDGKDQDDSPGNTRDNPATAADGAAPGHDARDQAAGGALSISGAARLVSEAIAESDAAAREARRLKNDVDAYQRQVESTRAGLESSTKILDAAQQNVMDNTIQAGLSEVRAPASGVVLSVASIAQDVAPGDPVVTIGRPGQMEVVLSDASGAWRQIREGATLTAFVDGTARGQAMGTPIPIHITDIAAPSARSGAALLRGTVDVRNAVGALQAGTRVLCTLARPGARQAMAVPVDSVCTDERGVNLVAVLRPVRPQAAVIQAIGNTHNQAGDAKKPAPASTGSETNGNVSNLTANEVREFHIEWRPVTVTEASQDGSQREISAGLRAGERIVMQAAAWRDWSSIHGQNAVISMAIS